MRIGIKMCEEVVMLGWDPGVETETIIELEWFI